MLGVFCNFVVIRSSGKKSRPAASRCPCSMLTGRVMMSTQSLYRNVRLAELAELATGKFDFNVALKQLSAVWCPHLIKGGPNYHATKVADI